MNIATQKTERYQLSRKKALIRAISLLQQDRCARVHCFDKRAYSSLTTQVDPV